MSVQSKEVPRIVLTNFDFLKSELLYDLEILRDFNSVSKKQYCGGCCPNTCV